ncbi:MAG: Kazal-type serine protease inhibitor family protein [Myxococcota bacterium]
MNTMLKNTWTILTLCVLFSMTTGCVLVADGEHGPWGERHDDYKDQQCEDGEECWRDWDGWDDEDDIDREGDVDRGDEDALDREGDVDRGDEDALDREGGVDRGDEEKPVGSGVCDMPESTEVCGEDGVTYLTPCDASRAKTRVAHDGACGPACAASAECGVYESCGGHGRCEPMTCTEEYVPVCGVDGITYTNACDAEAHHVAVEYDGECAPACTADADCAMGDLCESGRCEPANCPDLAADDHSLEVCGEDDFTYQSACHARLARQGVQHEGCCI